MPVITWRACPESWVGVASGTLGNRLECGRMRVPLDHLAPDGRDINIGVIRIRAADNALREGAIFFNQGGPGMHPGSLLRSMGEGWSGIRVDDPIDGDKRRLADRYDLVAVIPRGLIGSGRIRCVSDAPAPPARAFLPTHPDDANWQRVLDEAQATVDACKAPEEARYINTEQHAHDMDMLRRALGDERLHFYGISYGGMVGAWYASIYPTHTGRLLLDSTMDLMHGYRAAAVLGLAARQRAFSDNVVGPLLRNPALYGLGNSSDTVATDIDNLSPRAREAWVGRLNAPAQLAAALRLEGWLGSDNPLTLEAMTRLVDRASFSNDRELNRRIRWEAGQLAPLLYSASSAESSGLLEPEGDFVRVATGCNDVPWPRSEAEIRESSRRYAGRYFNFNGDETLEELTCLRWGGPSARRPDLAVLGRAAPFLLIQSEKDTSTPLAGAMHILDAFTNSRMLLVRNSTVHGVFNFTTSPCIERTAAHYLLTGELPATRSRAFACDDIFDNPLNACLADTPRPPSNPRRWKGPRCPSVTTKPNRDGTFDTLRTLCFHKEVTVKQTLAHRMLKTATLAVTFSAAAGSFAAVASTQAAVPAITWGPCGQELVDNDWTSELGPRLECGSMSALLDDDAPALGSVDVGLVRFKAGDPGRREGSIFFNFGGPGGNPLDFLPATGYLWSTRSADHPLDGDKRRLADRYDLVAVIPRGLRGGTRFSCHYTPGTMSTLDSALYLADWNWAGFVQEGRAYAEACGATSLHAYVGTLQHVRDMERARLALGEPALNFVGTSYGTWVGAFYAAMYPAHTGRVVLDSVMNYAGTFEDQLGNYPAERQALFARHALGPALAAPRIYGIGTNVRDVMARFFGMPHVAREAWASLIRTPGHLVAALTMADWVRTQWDITGDRLIARAQDYRFSPDATVNGRIRNAALDLAANFERGTAGSNEAGELDDDLYIAVLCGDTPWRKDKRALRALANRINADYSAANGTPVTIGLICAHWSSPPRPRPDIANLIKAPPLLLVQAEFDPATPFRGARRALDASPGSHMVLARNAHVHGLVGLSETPCIEHAVGRFLLTGELPDERLTGCDFVPASPARESRDLGNGPDKDNVRAELARRLRRS